MSLHKLLYLFRAKWILKKPKQAPVLIYDREGSDILFHYIDRSRSAIMDVRGESINIHVFLKTLFIKFIKNKSVALEVLYKNIFIDFVKPKVVLTFIDNSVAFYALENKNKDFVKVFIQNGTRGVVDDVFQKLELTKNSPLYKVDYMLVFGHSIAEKYANYIQGTALSIGSFRNNMQNIQTLNVTKLRKSILFISQYVKNVSLEDKRPVMFSEKDEPITWADFYAAEKSVLPFLMRYAERYGLDFCICARGEAILEERAYYESILGGTGWRLLLKSDQYSSYHHIESADYIVCIDSTLGYEALARGKRVASFSARGIALNSTACNFGWPARLPDSGPFWSNILHYNEYERIMNYIIHVNDKEWIDVSSYYRQQIIEYDVGNSRFVSLMKNLGVPLIS